MKRSYLIRLAAAVTLFLPALGAFAQPEVGKAYRLENMAYKRMLNDNGMAASVTVGVPKESNLAQVWYVESKSGSSFYLRNLATGLYLASPNIRSSAWYSSPVKDDISQIVFSGSDATYYTLRSNEGINSHCYLHSNSSYEAVCWSTDATASHWLLRDTGMTQAEIDAALEEVGNMSEIQNNVAAMQTALDAIFTDKACTILRDAYKSKTDAQLNEDANYKALPAVLRQMVRKVRDADWAETDNTFVPVLDRMYTDKTYTTLKDTYAGMSDSQLASDADFNTLPVELKERTSSIHSGTPLLDSESPITDIIRWDSKHAKKFRVQSYEPFSCGSEAAGTAGIQAYTNMEGPTGILSNAGSVLYIMVDKEPAQHSQIRINGAVGSGMFNDYNAGYLLHEGLNVIPCYTDDAHQFIYYTVQTVDGWGGKPAHKLSDFEPITIHIEGGSLNGFFDYTGDALYEADTDADWLYYRERARHEMFDIKGRYVMMHFHFDNVLSKADGGGSLCDGLKNIFDPDMDTWNRKYGPQTQWPKGSDWSMVRSIKAWDKMCLSERLNMGLQPADQLTDFNLNGEVLPNLYESLKGDNIASKANFTYAPHGEYHEYFNNRMMAITMQGDLYMNATSWRTAYNPNTMPDILLAIDHNSGAIWGPAHEYGHMNQGPIKIAGTTEISNNVFSNIAVYYQNIATSRSDFPSEHTRCFNAGMTYIAYPLWSCTRMYYQFFLYYHALGNNKKFYPRLYELLRNHPLQHPTYMNARYDQLHFYKMACIAAEEDLTDFFDSWGFFVPLDNYHIGDYANYYSTLTQEDIDAVKSEVAALNLPKNRAIIFVDDRPGSEKQSYEWFAKEDAGPMGGLGDFASNIQPKGNMQFSLSGFDVHVTPVTEGEEISGGIGFFIEGKNGELLGFSNDYTFPVSTEAAAALVSGEARVLAMGADQKTAEVTNAYLNADAATRLGELRKLINKVQPSLAQVDPDGKNADWYISFYAKPLQTALDNADKATEETDAETINNLYVDLINEYNALLNHEHARIPFLPNSTYQIRSAKYPERALGFNSIGKKDIVKNVSAQDEPKDIQQWVFEAVSGTKNAYNLKNVNTGTYMGTAEDASETADGQIPMVSTADKAGRYFITAVSQGKYALCEDENWNKSPNISGGDDASNKNKPITLWNADAAHSQWILRLVEGNAEESAKAELRQLIADATTLYEEAGKIRVNGEGIDLKAENISTNAPYTGDNAADAFTSFDVLLDNNIDTYFHSDYSGNNSSDSKNHCLLVDLGTGHEVSSFNFNYTTRNTSNTNSGVNAPTKITVYAGNNPDDLNGLGTRIKALSDLPEGSAEVYNSPVLETKNGEPCRYVKLVVDASTGNEAGGHPVFVMCEFGISHATESVETNALYPAITEKMILDIDDQLKRAQSTLDKGSNTSTLKTRYNALYDAYITLANAMGVEVNTGIDSIIVDAAGNTTGAAGIYDLQGRKISKITYTGIYIVDGKKMILRAGK